MSSSNRHWPSLFKSKSTSNTSPTPWHHDHLPRNLYTQDEERSPEAKPRWNPRPEQIRILEGIFNSGTVNPPRDEIRRIRGQLQEFGHVGDANVFYWFQNRKSRSKHKLRNIQTTKPRTPLTAAQASSSSSSDKSSPSRCNSNEKPNSSTLIDLLNSPTTSVNQPFLAEPLLFSGQEALTHGICFPDSCSHVDLVPTNHGRSSKGEDDDHKAKLPQHQIGYSLSPTSQIPQGPGLVEPTPPKSTVFINDVCFDVARGEPFNVREAFGNDVVLIQSSGQPVPTDEWGVTRQPLQHAAFYYLTHHTTPPFTWFSKSSNLSDFSADLDELRN